MKEGYKKVIKSIKHLEIFHDFFIEEENYRLPEESSD